MTTEQAELLRVLLIQIRLTPEPAIDYRAPDDPRLHGDEDEYAVRVKRPYFIIREALRVYGHEEKHYDWLMTWMYDR